MRIAINAAFLSGSFDGLSTYARSAIEDLSHSGDEVLVYASEKPDLNGNGRSKWRSTPSMVRAEKGILGNAFRALVWSQTGLPARLWRDRVQVLFSTLPEGMMRPVCPQVVVVHDLFPFFFPELYPRWKYYFRHVVPRVLKASSCIVAVSRHTKQDIVRQLGVPEAKIEVVYSWINPVFFSEQSGTPPEGFGDGPYFLFVGRSTPYKNLEMVVRAFAAVSEKIPHKLVCVLGITSGLDRAHYSEILDLATKLGVRDRLRVYTGIPLLQLLFLYKHATALVLLSRYEGFGSPPLEAMAAGAPVIVSDSTALVEVAGPAAVCVPNDDPGPAAEAMERLATDAAYRARVAEAGVAHAWKVRSEQSGQGLREVLGRVGGNGQA